MKLHYKLFSAALAAVIVASSSQFFSDVRQQEELIVCAAAEQEALLSFSAESGFYGTDFQLTLSAVGGGEIYYTTDGSNPASSGTAQLYRDAITVTDRTNQPNLYSTYEENSTAQTISRGTGYKKPTFSVDKATVVRAAVKNSDGTFSEVSAQTYFITNGNLSQYKDMTVVSLVTDPDNLFDPDKGIYVAGNQYIEWTKSSAYDPDKSVWDTDNIANFFSRGKEWERPANITIFEKGTVAVKQDMGIRIKGASTRNTAQKSFNLHARSEYGESKIKYPLLPGNYSLDDGKLIEKYDSVSLRSVNEEVRLRDSFSQALVHDRENLTTQDMKPCVLFLNGEYWGLYQITEKLSDYFVQSNYGIDKSNVAMIKSGELEEGSQEELYSFYNFANNYAKKDLSDTANYKAVCEFIDIDSMIEHYAAGLYLGTYDWPNYNYGVWRNTGEAIEGNQYSDGKWRFISYDYDYTMGATYKDFGGVEGYAYDSFRHMNNAKGQAPTNLFTSLLKNKEFRDKFAAVYCDYANEVISSEKTNALINYYSQNYTDLVANTQLRWWGFFGGTPQTLLPYYRNTYQDKTLVGLRTFFSQRESYTLEDMKEYTGLRGTLQTVTLQKEGNGKIQISSITPDISSGRWSGKYYSDCPVTLTAIADEGSSFTGWSGDVSSSENTITVTLEKAMNIQANFAEAKEIKGDINADGSFDVSDIVLMQKYMFGQAELTDVRAGDMNDDGVINISDLCLIKGELLDIML